MREEKVLIPSTGIQLEGFMNIQEALSFKGGVIFCHPHPQFGGDMYNSVIATAVEAASQEGFSTLRFNFRGVGESGGSYSEGIGEMEDVEATIDYLSSGLRDSNLPLILLGYSFGAWTGLPVAAKDTRVKGMVAIAPPLGLYDFGFLKGCKKRKLLIAGSEDPWCPASVLEEWYQQLEEPKSLAIIQGADHFFIFHTHLLTQPLREFFSSEYLF
jgi:alpha/beta superfamily hydrolase